jgi:hypothetical protein
MKHLLHPALVFFWLISTGFCADTIEWKKYTNTRFGFVLGYPETLLAGKEPAKGGGREFHTANNEFRLVAVAHFFLPGTDDSFETRWQEELKTPHVRITYQKKAANWYVVAGIAGNGRQYYHKFYRKAANWVTLQISYPLTKREKYDAWVEQIEKTFVPFQNGNFDRLE